MSPLITVIVPVYNAERYLSRCIDSILAQTFTNFELLLIEDGSPDSCAEICDRYAKKDCRIHVIHQQNCGVATTRNRGIAWAFENSQSQWIAYIDSDDYVHKQYLEILYNACIDNGVDFSTCKYLEIQDNTQPNNILPNNYSVNICSTEEAFVNNLVSCGPCNKLARKELYRNVRFPEGWHFGEDSATTYKIFFACPQIATIPLALYYYQSNGQSLTHSPWNKNKLVRLISSEEQLAFFFDRFPLAYKKSLEDTLGIITLFLYWRRRDDRQDLESLKILKTQLRKYINIYSDKYGTDKWKWYRYHIDLNDCDLYEKFRIYFYVLKEKLGLVPKN